MSDPQRDPQRDAAFAAARLEQLRRAAARPLAERLQWLEEAVAVADYLSHSPRIDPPAWACRHSQSGEGNGS